MSEKQTRATVITNTELAPGIFHMVLQAEQLAGARPGQFVMIRIQQGTAPLLRRPISLCGITPSGIELLYQVRGSGTACMAEWSAGHAADVIGPLGNGFVVPPATKHVYLVGGGIGVAPLIGFARWLRENCSEVAATMLLGGKTASDVSVLDAFQLAGCDVRLLTEDGTRGARGLVTDAIPNVLADMPSREMSKPDGSVLYGCGPTPMLKELARLAGAASMACQVSLEAHMACGTGACLGCVVRAAGDVGGQYRRVCADGPVFAVEEIAW